MKTTTIRALRAIGFLSALIVIAAFVMGCEEKRYTASPFLVNKIDGTTTTDHFELLCDEAMDVTYIKLGLRSKGGLAVRVDSTGAPVRCSAIRRRRR